MHTCTGSSGLSLPHSQLLSPDGKRVLVKYKPDPNALEGQSLTGGLQQEARTPGFSPSFGKGRGVGGKSPQVSIPLAVPGAPSRGGFHRPFLALSHHRVAQYKSRAAVPHPHPHPQQGKGPAGVITAGPAQH